MIEKILALAGGGSGGGGGGSAEPIPGCYINGNLVDIENSSRSITFEDPWNINELHLVFIDENTLDARMDENGYTDPPMECYYPPINRIAYHVVAEDDFEVFDYIYNGTMGAQEGTFFVSPNDFWIDGHEVDNSASTFEVLEQSAQGTRIAVHFVFVDGSTDIDAEIAISSDEVVSIPASLKPFSASLGNAESVSRLIGELPEA